MMRSIRFRFLASASLGVLFATSSVVAPTAPAPPGPIPAPVPAQPRAGAFTRAGHATTRRAGADAACAHRTCAGRSAAGRHQSAAARAEPAARGGRTASHPARRAGAARRAPGSGRVCPWYDAIEFRAFVDAYASVNYDFPKPQANANNIVRAYDTSNGFALSWVGVDATYPAEPVGGTVSLRFGPTANRIASSCLGGTCDSAVALTYVKQAFASWRPFSALTLDFGKFDTIYGAEVAESQDNMNYTRGVVYWFAQPLFHTGLRVNAQLSETLSLRGLLVNGINNTLDNNAGKSIGLQLGLNLPRSGRRWHLARGVARLPSAARSKMTPAVVHCDPATQYFNPKDPTGCSTGPCRRRPDERHRRPLELEHQGPQAPDRRRRDAHHRPNRSRCKRTPASTSSACGMRSI